MDSTITMITVLLLAFLAGLLSATVRGLFGIHQEKMGKHVCDHVDALADPSLSLQAPGQP